MATVTPMQGHQSLQIAVIALDNGETATVALQAARQAKVDWFDGGVSWTITPQDDAADDFEVVVEHSLAPEGNYWVPDQNSPFDEKSGGAERNRIERVRFTNTGNGVNIVVASASKFEVAF